MKSAQHRSNSKTLQEFFKVFLPETSSTQLRIPKAFTKFFNGITSSEATLVDHDKNSWDIELAKIEDHMVFKNGWQQFAKEKCLEEGDFLIFEYDGKSTFYVKIFYKTGCRKEAANCGKIVPIVILDEDSDQNCRKIQRGSKRKHSRTVSLKIYEKSDSEGPSKGVTRAYEANGNDHEKKAPAPAKCVPLKKPHFVITFSRWRLNRVEIPRGVLRQWSIKLVPKMSLRDENDKLWPVMISTTEQGRHYFGDGWSDFRKSNNIQQGHQCDFQFVIGKANVAQELLVRVHPFKMPKVKSR